MTRLEVAIVFGLPMVFAIVAGWWLAASANRRDREIERLLKEKAQ